MDKKKFAVSFAIATAGVVLAVFGYRYREPIRRTFQEKVQGKIETITHRLRSLMLPEDAAVA